MTESTPKISVCMPVYNGSEYIAEAIESVLNQTWRDFRLFVVDNCSTDNTAEIVRRFDDPRIRYERNPQNIGLVGNANRCLELAEGQYVCIFHHDDVMLPDNLERKIRLLDEHPDVGFVHSDMICIDSTGRTVADHIWYKDSRKDYIEDGAVIFRKCLEYMSLGATIFIGAVVARRTCYDRVGNFRAELPHCSDCEMWMRMALFYRVACIGSPLVKYRVLHATSTSSSFGNYKSIPYLREHFRAVEMVFDAHAERIPESRASREKSAKAFAYRAISLSYSAYAHGNAEAGGDYMKEAVAFYPDIVWTPRFWKTAARKRMNPGVMRLLRRLRDASMNIIS